MKTAGVTTSVAAGLFSDLEGSLAVLQVKACTDPNVSCFGKFSDLTISWCLQTVEDVGCLDIAQDFYNLEIK